MRYAKSKCKLALFSSLLFLSVSSFAQEQRCNELTSNCICSAALTGPIVNRDTINETFGVDPPSAKPCGGRGGEATSFGEGNLAWDVFNNTDPAVLALLPNGSSAPGFLAIPESVTDGFMGGGFPGINGQCGTWAIRWYHYRSVDWRMDGGTGKQFMYWINSANQWARHDLSSSDTKLVPPEGTGLGEIRGPIGPNGKWHRYEFVWENCKSNAVYKVYEKNVTDNTPEQVILNVGPISLPILPTIMTLNVNRQWGTQFEQGSEGWLYFMIAAWDQPGQRIGPAYEIEGGGGTTLPQRPFPPILRPVQ